MGSGKSQVGRLLGASLSVPFVDLDREIEISQGLPIPEIFTRLGESGFRNLESAALRRLSFGSGDLILATGGGVVLDPENREILKKHYLTLWLDVPAHILAERMKEDRGGRPLLPSDDSGRMHRIEAMLAAREALYDSAAQIRYRWVESDDSAEASAEAILEALRHYHALI
jgi:shikimate kinase